MKIFVVWACADYILAEYAETGAESAETIIEWINVYPKESLRTLRPSLRTCEN